MILDTAPVPVVGSIAMYILLTRPYGLKASLIDFMRNKVNASLVATG